MFLVIPIVLTILIVVLIVSLKVKQKTMDKSGVPNSFGREMRNLLLILAIFDISFLIRFTVDSIGLGSIGVHFSDDAFE